MLNKNQQANKKQETHVTPTWNMLEPMILIINPNENNENHESSNLLRSYLSERYIVFFLVNLDFSCYIFSSYIY